MGGLATCSTGGAFTNPTVDDFKTQFVRDFPYGTSLDTVQDQDIQSGLNDAAFNFNPGLFANQTEYTMGFLLLAAHFMVFNLQASSQGIAGQYNWLTSSKGVGSVSESFQIPDRIMQNPELAMYSKTRYGAKYLMFLLPRMIGQTFTTFGPTKP